MRYETARRIKPDDAGARENIERVASDDRASGERRKNAPRE
jgi:hypothetical protein